METGFEKIKYQLKGLTLDELNSYFINSGEQGFRGSQLFNWIYNHLVNDFDEMLNFPKSLRKKLKENCLIKTLELVTVQQSANSKTKKYLFKTIDDKKIESVIIPEKDRATLCISTQVGCPLDCKFCATGLMGYKRNLTVGEIVEQYLIASKDYGKENITNIVYMGMGEPLLNFENTIKSLSIFTNELTKGVSRTRITISTAGIPQKIIDLANSKNRVKLALSLHSCFEDVRSLIMPINRKFSLKENINALKLYTKKTRTRATFEYIMLSGINDTDDDTRALTKLCKEIPSKVNIIPFNSISHMNPVGISSTLVPTPRDKILKFVEKLRDNNITVMVRDTQGDDIAAACGQLAIKN